MSIENLNPIEYYKAISGQSDLSSDEWYLNYSKKHSFSIYSDFDAIDEAGEKVIVPPVENKNELINTFSNKSNLIFDNTKIVNNGDGTESVELELEDRIITIVVDQSGSMTWNDNDGTRFTMTEELIHQIENNYPGNIRYNLIKYGAIFSNIILFSLKLTSESNVSDINSLTSLYSANDDSNFAGIRVVRNSDHYPTSYLDGDIVEDSFMSKVFDEDIEEGQIYYYTVYTFDKKFRFSEGVRIKAVPRSRIIPRGISIFESWNSTDNTSVGQTMLGSGVIKDDKTIGIWHCDEGIENTLYDFSSSQSNLQFNEEPIWIPEQFVPAGSSGVWFNGSTTEATYNDVDNDLAFRFTHSGEGSDGITIMMWVYPYSLNSSSVYPLVQRVSINRINYYLAIRDNGLEFGVGDGNPSYIENPSVLDNSVSDVLERGVWQHVAVTFDPTTFVLKFYVNGKMAKQGSLYSSAWDISAINSMNFSIGGTISSLGDNRFFGKITEVSLHRDIREISYIEQQAIRSDGTEINSSGVAVPVVSYNGLKGDNGDRLIIIKYYIPDDYNFEGGNVVVLRKEKTYPSWEEDGTVIKNHSNVSPGLYYITDTIKFVQGETYYYRIFSQNTNGNFSYFTDSPYLKFDIPIGGEDFWPDLTGSIVGPEQHVSLPLITEGSQKIFLRWTNTFSLDNRVERVRVYYSYIDFPVLYNAKFSGELVFSGLINEEKFVHRNLQNDIPVYYTIVNVDKYGRFSDDTLKIATTPYEGANEDTIPLIEVTDLRYDLVKEDSLSLIYNIPQKDPENVDAYFDETIFVYASLTDEFGNAVPEESLISLELEAKIIREIGVEDVFSNSPVITFIDSEAYDFVVSDIQNGIIRASLRVTPNVSISSQIEKAEFNIKLKSYIPDSNDPNKNVFEYTSKSLTVVFTNPWEVELVNRDEKYVTERCFYHEKDDITKEEILYKDVIPFNGVYVGASAPFVARAKIWYKGEPLTEGSLDVDVWDAEMDLCNCAGKNRDKCIYVGSKIQRSESIRPPSNVVSILTGTESQTDINGNTVNIPISYVDIPLYTGDIKQSVLLYVKGTNAGFVSFKKLYIVFQSTLRIDVNANSPLTNDADVAEQQSTVYIVHPDYPEDASRRTYPVDDSIVQWGIIARSRERSIVEFLAETLPVVSRSLYSIDNVPISNGVYSYTRSGTARNVFLGPISRDEDGITERHEINATIVYEGFTAIDRQEVVFGHKTQTRDTFGNRFLMELEHDYRYAFHNINKNVRNIRDGSGYRPDKKKNTLWTDGSDYIRLFISRNPATALDYDEGGKFLSADKFRICADAEGAPLYELNSSGQVVFLDSGDEKIEFLHGEIYEVFDEYLGISTLEIGPNGFTNYGSAYVELNNEDVSDTTVVYIRANKEKKGMTCQQVRLAARDECLGETVNCESLEILDCYVPGGDINIDGLTTVYVNGEPLQLRGGGGMTVGIPPTPICFKEPLLVKTVQLIIDGVEVDHLINIPYSSVIEMTVEVSFRGDPVPDNTPLTVIIGPEEGYRLGFSNLFVPSSNIIYTSTDNSDGKSYATVRVVASRFETSSVREIIEIISTYDENGKTDRRQSTSNSVKTIAQEVETSSASSSSSSSSDIVDIEEKEVNVFSGEMHQYNVLSNEWKKVSNMIEPRGESFVGTVEEKLYVIGGLKNNLKNNMAISGIVEEYDMLLDEWENKSSMPTSRYGGNTVVVDDNIYTFGGIEIDDADKFETSTVVEVYNVSYDIWSSLTSMPTDSGIAFGTAQHVIMEIGSEIKNYVYILSGVSQIDAYSSTMEMVVFNNKILRYCIEDDEWETSIVNNNNNALNIYQREYPLSLVKDNKIIVFNGAWPWSRELFNYPESEIFSIPIQEVMTDYINISDALSYFDLIPEIKYYSNIVKTNFSDDYYTMGGTTDVLVDGRIEKVPLNIVEKINVGSDVFVYENSQDIQINPSILLSSMPVYRYGHGMVWGTGFNGSDGFPSIYVIGGYTNGMNENWLRIEWSL